MSDVDRMLDKMDFLEHPLLGPGRLGMTSVPGRDMARWERDPLLRDVLALAGLRTHRIVCLLPQDELAALGSAQLPTLAAHHEIAFSQVAIHDGHAPPDVAAFTELVTAVVAELLDGHTVVAHCRAGFGRTGTFAACCLVARGLAADEAIAHVRSIRRYAVESRAQEEFVRDFVPA